MLHFSLAGLGPAGGSTSPEQIAGFGSPCGHQPLAWDGHQPRHVPDYTADDGALQAGLANGHMLPAGKTLHCLLASVSPTQVRGSLWEFSPMCAWETSLLESQTCPDIYSYYSMHFDE